MEEVKGLLRHEPFGWDNVNNVIMRSRIFGPIFFEIDKTVRYNVRYKERLVAQIHGYRDTVTIVTRTHIVHQFSQRLVLSTAALLTDNSYHEQNVAKAHTQSTTLL